VQNLSIDNISVIISNEDDNELRNEEVNLGIRFKLKTRAVDIF